MTVTLPASPFAGGHVTEAASALLLLVEDDQATRHAVATNLRGHEYRVTEAADGEEALRVWERGRPDLILLDLGLPGIDGIAVVRRVRRDATTPIIVLSARNQERDKVAALDAGADDYLTKPFGMQELHARVRAALRRVSGTSAAPDGSVRIGSLSLDPTQRRVTVYGGEVHLTPREYELLKTLLANAGRVVGRGRLLRAVWGDDYVRGGPLPSRPRRGDPPKARGGRPGGEAPDADHRPSLASGIASAMRTTSRGLGILSAS